LYPFGDDNMTDQEKKNVTLYLNTNLYDDYVDFCKREGYALSRRIEKFIENELKSKKE